MNNKFDATAWREGARLTDVAREAWESRCFAATQTQPVTGDGSIPLDAYLTTVTSELRQSWYDLIGNAGIALGSDASKMNATAQNYSATEAQAVEANARFWS